MPFARFEWMLALRYLRARRRESFISVISGFSLVGIALGVATLIIVMAVMNGFRIELMDRILGVNGHILVSSWPDKLYDFDRIAETLRGLDGIERVAPMVEGQAMASAHEVATGALVRGFRKDDLKSLKVVSDNVLMGSLDNFDKTTGVAVGSRLAQHLRLRVGDRVTLISPRGAVTPFGTTPRIKAYPVLAIFEMGMSEYDATFVFMPLREAQLYFNTGPEAVTALEIMVEDPDAVSQLRSMIQASVDEPLRILDWQQTNSTFFGALEVERNVMFLILTLIILVAALNIISGLIMLVKDKGHDIAILRSMGASQGAVMRIFFITGSAIGVVGTTIGFTLGVAFCTNIESLRQGLSRLLGTELFSPEVYFLTQMPAKMETHEVAAVVVIALGLSFLATLYPSWRAARLDPVEALRYE